MKMNRPFKIFFALTSFLVFSFASSALAVGRNWVAQNSTQPKVGREAAAKYFDKKVVAEALPRESSSNHYLALMVGKIMSSQAYEWGTGSGTDVGDWDASLTYRVNEWNSSMDFSVRVNFSQYKFPEDNPMKMSIMPLLTFPEAASKFPLYFGAGVGPGVFFKQLPSKSSLSLDYQLVIGARFFDIFENSGFVIETGLKNHLHLLTTGQLNGTFLNLGAVFTF